MQPPPPPLTQRIHLWELPILNLSSIWDENVYQYTSFEEFLKTEFKEGKPSISNNIGIYVMTSWEWKPSIKKAKDQNIKEVLDRHSLQELENKKRWPNAYIEEPFEEFIDKPIDKHEENKEEFIEEFLQDDSCDIYYENYDYLHLALCEIYLNRCRTNFKILVTDEDEPKVLEFLKNMKNKMQEVTFRF